MRIDPKYFNTFLVVVAIFAAALITFFTFNSQQSKRAAFKKRIVRQDSLTTVPWVTVERADSIRIDDFKDQYVLLQFWSDWLDAPDATHRKLAKLQQSTAGNLVILSAMVGFEKEQALNYVKKQGFSIYFVAGSTQFSEFGVPGVPAYLLFNPLHEIEYVSLGTLKKSQLDSLRMLMIRGN